MRKKLFFSWLTIGCFIAADAFSLETQIQVASSATCSSFEVRLSENPTTGFQWTLKDYDKKRFSFIKDSYVSASTKRMGASGVHIFYFKQEYDTSCPESTELVFRHARSWEADSAKDTKITVNYSQKNNAKN